MHSKFILTPLSNILKDAVSALSGLSFRMETYPMAEYIFQSIFLKMTGASEQKLKCICWDMATHDYQYRYDYLNNKQYGEHSDFKAKKGVIKDLCERIINLDNKDIDINSLIPNKKTFINNSINEVIMNVKGSLLLQWNKKDYDFFCRHHGYMDENQIKLKNKQLIIESSFWDDYTEYIWKHRNRCAHNLLSYQTNLPTLSKLTSDKYEYDNYYYRFSLIIFLDNVYMLLYKTYQETLGSM